MKLLSLMFGFCLGNMFQILLRNPSNRVGGGIAILILAIFWWFLVCVVDCKTNPDICDKCGFPRKG